MLPFADRTPEGSLDALTAALTETLAHSLAQSQFLEIIPPNGVLLMRARGAPEDSLGRMLSADYLVGGSVSRYDDHVRVDIELLDGRSGSVVRTEVVDRLWAQSRILVDDVVRSAATFLRREVGEQIEIARVRALTTSEEAWRLVLEAKAIQDPIAGMLSAGEYDAVQRDLARADSALEIAADLDRRWAEPVVLRGWVRERQAFITRVPAPGDTTRRRELLEAGLHMADLAADRDETHAGVHELRGALLYQLALLRNQPADSIRSRLNAAEAELRRATSLDPLSQSSWRRLADLLHFRGHYSEAKNAAQRAYRLDSFASDAQGLVNLLFSTFFELGDDVQAESWCLDGRRRFPDGLPGLYCLYALHAWADGIEPDVDLLRRDMAKFREANRRQSGFELQPQLVQLFDAMLAAAYARAEQPDSARAILDRLESGPPDQSVLWVRAAAYTALHEDSTAVALLREYLERGSWEAPRVAASRPFWRLGDNAELQRLISEAAPEF